MTSRAIGNTTHDGAELNYIYCQGFSDIGELDKTTGCRNPARIKTHIDPNVKPRKRIDRNKLPGQTEWLDGQDW